MKTFYVKVSEVYTTDIKVQAKDEDDAREKAVKCLSDGCEYHSNTPLETAQYDYTLDKEDWVVYE